MRGGSRRSGESGELGRIGGVCRLFEGWVEEGEGIEGRE